MPSMSEVIEGTEIAKLREIEIEDRWPGNCRTREQTYVRINSR